MKVACLVLTLASSAAAFPPALQKASTALSVTVGDMPGSTAPLKTLDPLGLATLGSDQTLSWFRAAELKHSRVAMLATTGYLVQAAGIRFPGQLSKDVSFESLSTMKPLDDWDAVPDAGKIVISCSSISLVDVGIFTGNSSWF
jgi:hypothetical protein